MNPIRIMKKQMNKKGMLAQLVGGFIVLLIGFTLMPMIFEQVEIAQANITMSGNVTSPLGETGGMILTLVPVAFVLGLVMVALTIAVSGLRSAGLIGGGEEYGDDEDEYEDLNGDGVIDENEEMLSKLSDGKYPKENKDVIEESLTEAEEDLKNYKNRNNEYHKNMEKDIKKESSYDEVETTVDQLSETKKGLIDYRKKMNKYKDGKSDTKSVSEEELKKSKFD